MSTTSTKISRRAWLASAAAAASAPAWMRSARAESRPPNIIFAMADDLGYGDLGCYGQERIQTPRIDAMAAQGMRFTQCYAGSTVCAPSRCVLMTGLHTGHCYVRGNRGRDGQRVPLRPEDVTVADILQQAGYATGQSGKWGLGDPGTTGVPNRQGFDYFYGYLNQRHAHDYYPEVLFRNEEEVRLEGNRNVEEHVHGDKGTYSPKMLTEEALDFVERHQDEPFFLYWSMIRPHAANQSGRYYGNETGEGMPVPTDEPYSDEDWPQPQKNHAAMITQLDADMGRMLAKLEELGIAGNTLVIFTSDNGPHAEGGADPDFFQSGGPLRGIKRDLYEGGIRVPAIAWWPGTITPGQVNHHMWAFEDFLPTCTDLAGIDTPAGLDGISFAPLLAGTGEAQQKHDSLYWEFHERGFRQAVRFGDWKAVRYWSREQMEQNAPPPLELYNLAVDIGESNDIAAEHPELVARAEEILVSSRTPSHHWPLPGEDA